MTDDFIPIVHQLDGRTIKCYAVADVHIGAKECDLDGFKRFLKHIENDDDAYLLLCGDLINNGVKDSLTNVYDEVIPPGAQIEKAVELLQPVAGKILGCVSGNHEHRTKKAVDIEPAAYICSLLRVPEIYRQNMAFVRVNLVRGNTKNHYALLLVHGKTANKQKNFGFAIEGVDAIVSGHLHSGQVRRDARICMTTSNRVVVKPFVSIVATSWVKYGGYAARSLCMPAATSTPQCLLLEFTGSNATPGQIRVAW